MGAWQQEAYLDMNLLCHAQDLMQPLQRQLVLQGDLLRLCIGCLVGLHSRGPIGSEFRQRCCLHAILSKTPAHGRDHLLQLKQPALAICL